MMAMVASSAVVSPTFNNVFSAFQNRKFCNSHCLLVSTESRLRSARHLQISRGRSRSSNVVAEAAAASTGSGSSSEKEEVFFDGGPHYGDLIANLVFGFTLFWLPLTVAAVFRALFLRYRFTSYRVTILSGLTGGDRKDFKYEVIKDVKYVPRFIGEWGDVVITLKDDTQVELKSLPHFKEVAKFCLEKAGKAAEAEKIVDNGKGKKKGFL